MERLTDYDMQRLRVTLCDIKRRCNNPNDPNYKDYGGRGIDVCAEWMDKINGHESFRIWSMCSGYKRGLSIDRINNELGYSPNNCRWATKKEQANNTRRNIKLTIGRVTKTITEWSEIFQTDSDLVLKRYRRGITNIKELFDIPENSTKPIPVVRLEDKKIYNSISECAADINGIPDKISLVCKGKRKTHMGYTFKYLEDNKNAG